jgi:hypothetical protein
MVLERCGAAWRFDRVVVGFEGVHKSYESLKPSTGRSVRLRVHQALDLFQRGSMANSRLDRASGSSHGHSDETTIPSSDTLRPGRERAGARQA